MHLQSPYSNIAFIEKAIGLNGDVVMSLSDDISFFTPALISALAACKLHVVPPPDPNEAPRTLHVSSIEGIDIQKFFNGEHPSSAVGFNDGERHAGAGFNDGERPVSDGANDGERPVSDGANDGERPSSCGQADGVPPTSGGQIIDEDQFDYDQKAFRVHFKELNSLKEARLLCGHFLFMSNDNLSFVQGIELQEQGMGFQNQGAELQEQGAGLQAKEKGAQNQGNHLQKQNTTSQVENADMRAQSKWLLNHTIKVIDERYGDLGILQDIIKTPANDVWVLNGDFGEVLIPVIDDCADSFIPDDNYVVHTHIIDGLIDSKDD